MVKITDDSKAVDAYIREFPKETQTLLNTMRKTIQELVPHAVVRISYGIPAFNLNNRYLIYFAGWKKHVSLYPISRAMESSMKEMAKYTTSGRGTIQFPLDKPLPIPLIKKIVKYRMKENTALEALKKVRVKKAK